MHPPFQMPTFRDAYNSFKFPIIKHFENIITDKGFKLNEFWAKIDDAIVNIVRNSESYMIKTVSIW